MKPEPPIPADMQAYADMMNAWTEAFARLGPVGVTFRVDLTTLHRRTPAGPVAEKAVRMWAVEPTGPHVLFLPPPLAEELGSMLIAKAREARTILLPVNGHAHA